jgi:hypothetical protein
MAPNLSNKIHGLSKHPVSKTETFLWYSDVNIPKNMINMQNLFMANGVTALLNHKLMCTSYKTEH